MFLPLIPPLALTLGPGIVRFDADGAARKAALPSLALMRPDGGRGRQPGRGGVSAKIDVAFGAEGDRRTARVAIEPGTDLYGTGEIAGSLRRNGKVTETWNTDAGGADERYASLYQSHPWVLAVRKDGTAYGVFADTTYRCRMDLRDGIAFAAEGPAFPVYVIESSSPEGVVRKLADLTGKMELPPMWALGYHQCRFSYMSETEALEIAGGFRDRKIPCDTIWFDIDYMDGFRVFTFDKKRFPDPKRLNTALHAQGFHNVYMIDPAVKVDPEYDAYRSGGKADAWVKRADGTEFNGNVWAGPSAFPDFTRAATRAWWAGLYKPFVATGIDGIWNDMNEPAVFGGPGGTMPRDNVHRADAPYGQGDHARFHNTYGRFMVQASHDGLLAANPQKRPFLLTRAGYLGYQRYAATWTGDNIANWGGMRNGITMILNLGLSGQPFAGPDIGGFLGDGPDDPAERTRFFARWFGLGALLPFARGHTVAGSIRKEPWQLGPHVESVARIALERRYRLLPYLYTQFHTAATTGLPVSRPLFFADPKNAALRAEERGYLLGPDLAVEAPLDGEPHASPLPWVPLSIIPGDDDPDQPKLALRPGAIVPLGDVQQYVGEKPFDHLTLLVALDPKGAATGRMYEDAGDGFGYRKGDYRTSTFTASRKGDRLTLRFGRAEGRRKLAGRRLTIRAYVDGRWVVAEGTEGKTLDVPL